MKKLILFLSGLIGLCMPASAQITGSLFGTYWNGSNEISRKINLATSGATDLSVLAGVSSMAQGITTYDAANKRYFNYTNGGIKVIDALSGNLLSAISTTMNFYSMEYNPNANNLIGVYWTGSTEIVASLNISTSSITNLAVLPGVTSIVQGESTFDAAGNRYYIKTNIGVMGINAATGAIVTTATTTLKGIEFNPNTGKLVGSYWTGTNEIFASLDPATGVVTNIATLAGVTSIIQGESTFDATGNRYFNKPTIGTLVIDAQTGAVLSTIPSSVSIAGIEYLGLSSGCDLTATLLSPAQINTSTGSTVQFSVQCNSPLVSIQWQSNPGNFGWMNIPNNVMYSGATTPVLTVNSVALQNHLQPFRAIASTNNCSDTSQVSIIHINDTCIVTIIDTLVVNVPTGVKQSTQNSIRIYPNPASNYLVIDNGDVSQMTGYFIKISDNLGREIFNRKITQKEMTVDLSALSARGLYYLEIMNDSGGIVLARKIIIQ